MPVSGPFAYSIANDFPGGQFNAAISDNLQTLIAQGISSATLLDISSDGTDVTITFSGPLSDADKTLLDDDQSGPAGGYIAQSCWRLHLEHDAVTLNDDDVVSETADGIVSLEFTIQLKDGDGNPIAGIGNVVAVQAAGLAPITGLTVTLDETGAASFTVGPSTSRGNLAIALESNALTTRHFTAQFA